MRDPSPPGAPAVALEGGFRTGAERNESALLAEAFAANPLPPTQKLDHFVKWARRPALTRFLALYELYKRVLPVKGSVVDCGVHHGTSLMAWAKLSAILEPVNLTRRIYGFDTFAGFPNVAPQDFTPVSSAVGIGALASESHDELLHLAQINDSTRFLGHIPKVELLRGDAAATIPAFVQSHPHLLVSLLFLDFDLYEPTVAALKHLLPRMPRGAVLAFDELDNPLWPGETQAMLEVIGAGKLRIERLEFDPYIGFAVIE